MASMDMNKEVVTKEDLLKYYDECWLERFEKGHNPKSLAMHLGYFTEESMDNDAAKVNTNKFLAEHLGIKNDTKASLADFGCGIGGTCIYLAKNYPNLRISGINISSTQVDFANRIKEQNNINGQIEYLISDYSKTNLADSSLDYVIAVESICHAVDKQKVYSEAYRVLKPGGRFVFMDYFEEREANTPEELEWLSDFRKGWAIIEYIRNHGELLSQVDFSHITQTSLLDKVGPGILNSYTKAVAKLGDNSSETFNNHLKACVALKELTDRGIIDYKIITAQK